MKKAYLENLNEVQKEVVTCGKGPMMVIAGAGSGKTSVLTYRIAHLIKSGVNPFDILALTFTNKAAKEMKERISTLVEGSEAIWMGTFHSVFYRILRMEATLLGYPSNFLIYDIQDSESVIKKIIEELSLDKDIYKPKHVLSRISHYKNNLITVKAYFNDIEVQQKDVSSMRPRMGELYKAYVDRCFQAGVMDFDDLLLKTNELLTLFPAILYKYQERFKYILVDEYQDTNHSQYLIVKLLASRYENICIVGDDAQSIYSFRGANIDNILNFQKYYPDAKIFRLEQNYRSTQTIVDAANSIISKNKNQLRKKVWTQNKKGKKIKLYRAISEVQEASYLANVIERKVTEEGCQNKDFGILYRTNSQSRAIEEALLKKNISYQIYGGLSFFQKKEIKDFLAYLKILINKKDEESLNRIINYPTRGIGSSTLEKISLVAREEQKTLYEILENVSLCTGKLLLSKGVLSKIEAFVFMIKDFETLSSEGLSKLAENVAVKSGLIDLLKADESELGKSRYENLKELLASIQAYEQEQSELVDGDPSLSGFLESISLFSHLDVDPDDTNKVSLMSIHLSKGLEFPFVFVTGLEEGIFPSSMNFYSLEEMEEERRLFYVALTRAKEELFLSYAVMRSRWGKFIEANPSRFISEIEEEFLDQTLIEESDKIFGLKKNYFTNQKEKKPQVNSSVSQFTNLKKLSEIDSTKESNYKIPNLDLGMKVFHQRFGKGKVIKLQGSNQDKMAVISFEEVGEKKLLLKFAKLRILNS